MIDFLIGYAPALLATVAAEGALAFFLSPRPLRRRCLQASVSLNLLTHPLATLVLMHANAPLLLLEVAVTGAEYVGYRALVGLGAGRAALLAVLANLLTTAMALALAAG